MKKCKKCTDLKNIERLMMGPSWICNICGAIFHFDMREYIVKPPGQEYVE